MISIRKIVILGAFLYQSCMSGLALGQEPTGQKTFVYVHGAFSSIATALNLESILESRGHRMYLASLTGLGDRAHLQNPEIRLETHIQDVANLIETRDLRDVYLVGSSYGGMVVTGAWDRMRDRIHHVVYLDAFVPEAGKSARDYFVGGEGSAFNASDDLEAIAAENDGFVAVVFGERTLRQSLYTFTDPLELQNGPLPQRTLRTFVRAVGNDETRSDPTFQQFADRFRADPNWQYLEIATGHGIHWQDPDGLADLLVELE